jgi:di/tricarboxylate transporter
VGITSGIIELQDIPGLIPAAHKIIEEDLIKYEHNIVEAVVSESSPLLGKTVKEADFRRRYSAGVIAIHRNGERIQAKIGDVPLRAGDVLLLLAKESFLHNWSESSDFYLISKIKERSPKNQKKGIIAIAIITFMVMVVALSRFLPTIGGYKISMFYAAAAAAAFMIITGCVNVSQAKNSIKFNVLLTIVAALGISKALVNSGVATVFAKALVDITKGLGPIGVLAGIYIITAVFAAVLTNIAAVAIVFPIAYSAAFQFGVNPRPFFIAIVVAAAASFITPIGYQTNLIVQGAGGYKFKDYVRVGTPLAIIFFVIAIFAIPIFWGF